MSLFFARKQKARAIISVDQNRNPYRRVDLHAQYLLTKTVLVLQQNV